MSDERPASRSEDPTDVARELHAALISAARAISGDAAKDLYAEASVLLDELFLVDRTDPESVRAFQRASRRRMDELTRWPNA